MPEVLLKQLEKPATRFLVFTSAGRHARVSAWLRGKRNFDLWVTCYAPGGRKFEPVADYYLERPGGKFPNLYYAFQHWPGIFDQYEAVFVMDDDLQISGSSISKLFQLLLDYDLWVVQPAFSQFGKVSHRVTVARLFSYLRFTNFVEVTCPLFRIDKLKDFMSIYDPSLVGWGADHWFMQHLVGDRRNKAAIVDAITTINPHDETKGRREIHLLQPDEVRKAAWERIRTTRQLQEVNPIRTWSTVRKFGGLEFYRGTLITLFTKVVVKCRHLLQFDPG